MNFKPLPFLGGLALLGGCGTSNDAASNTAPPAGPPAPVTLHARPDAGPGERLFIEKCAMCHTAGGMGTGLLARRSDRPLLEKREDLTTEFVIQAARMGIGNMPAAPRGEVSDEEMDQIAAYLAHDPATPSETTSKEQP